MGNPLAVKGLRHQLRNLMVAISVTVIKSFDTKSSYICSDRRNLSKGRLHRVFVQEQEIYIGTQSVSNGAKTFSVLG